MNRPQLHSLRQAALLTVLGLLLAGGGIGVAQEATPSAAGTPHPAHIHAGTCAELGDVVFPLSDVAAPDAATPEAMAHDMSTPDAMEMPGTPESDSGNVVSRSTTEVEASLDDILATGHAINVHESQENIGTYIACGDITGEPANSMLMIELEELNDSGYTGEASLIDNGDGTTTVMVTLMATGSDAMGTPAASGDTAPAASVQVTIKDFTYNPDPVTIQVGQSVTWTNEDSAPHTATAMDRDVLQSGTLNQGESYTQVFDTPGTYEYFCEFHAGMKGVIIVV